MTGVLASLPLAPEILSLLGGIVGLATGALVTTVYAAVLEAVVETFEVEVEQIAEDGCMAVAWGAVTVLANIGEDGGIAVRAGCRRESPAACRMWAVVDSCGGG